MIKKVEDNESNNKRVASSDVMNMALELVSSKFNLDDSYTMIAFKDGAVMCQVTLANEDFEVSVKIRDKEESMGLNEDED